MSNRWWTIPCGAFGVVLLLASVPTPAGSQETPIKIGVVDVEQVVAESPQGKDLQSRLETFQAEVQSQLDAMQEEAKAIRRRIAEGGSTLTQERVSQLEKEYEDAGIAIRRYRDDKQREAQKLQDQGLRKIEKILEPVFKQAQEEMGLDILINRVPGVVILTSDRIDITAAMIERVAAASDSSE